jgi:hypothetical protein
MRTTRVLVLLPLVAIACGPAAIEHTGYPEGDNSPWNKNKKVQLDERYEAKVDGTVSYPKRERARWYAVDLPADGKMTATVSIDPRVPGADVGVEILDAGFNVVSKDVDDELQPKKERVADNVGGGKAYIHIYTLKRPDEADYTLRLKFAPSLSAVTTKPEVGPTDDIANLPELPLVPPMDPKRRTGGPVRPHETPVKPEVKPKEVKGVGGSIVEFGTKEGKVRLIINKGSEQGVEAGWRGFILSAKTKSKIEGSEFTVTKVKATESEALVGVGMDIVQQNRGVMLIKPAE